MEISQYDQTQGPSSEEPQKRVTEHQSETLGGSQANSGDDGDDTKRFDRSYSGWRNSKNPICFFIGGILKQSRAQMEERLQECEDCLKWYEDGKQKVLKQIEELNRLEQELENAFANSEEE